MAVLSKEEFFNRLNGMVGDSQDDAAISFMEDMSDTYADLESRAAGDGVDWEQKFKDNDAAWRKKYTTRFFSTGGGNYVPPDEEEPEKKDPASITFDDIFRKKEC